MPCWPQCEGFTVQLLDVCSKPVVGQVCNVFFPQKHKEEVGIAFTIHALFVQAVLILRGMWNEGF